MQPKTFKALVVEETPDKKFVRYLSQTTIAALPPGDVLIKVVYSSLNYKDALSAVGNRGVTKQYPHTPGIDAAGIVEHSSTDTYQPGDAVLVTGYDLGMNTSGGFGQYIRVPAGWVVKLPDNLTLKESMAYGTAGFTAAQSVLRLEQSGITPESGEVLVTGATGGVGSIALAILAKDGYQVVAATGKPDQQQYLLDLGARRIISRNETNDTSGRPLLPARWAGVVDTVGGNILATAIKSTKHRGTLTTCGNVAAAELSLTVYPFILRGVGLLGIDSAECPYPMRRQTWQKLATDWKLQQLDRISREITLDELGQEIDLMLQGKKRGRVILNLRA